LISCIKNRSFEKSLIFTQPIFFTETKNFDSIFSKILILWPVL
jgi:hypothetical protein